MKILFGKIEKKKKNNNASFIQNEWEIFFVLLFLRNCFYSPQKLLKKLMFYSLRRGNLSGIFPKKLVFVNHHLNKNVKEIFIYNIFKIKMHILYSVKKKHQISFLVVLHAWKPYWKNYFIFAIEISAFLEDKKLIFH